MPDYTHLRAGNEPLSSSEVNQSFCEMYFRDRGEMETRLTQRCKQDVEEAVVEFYRKGKRHPNIDKPSFFGKNYTYGGKIHGLEGMILVALDKRKRQLEEKSAIADYSSAGTMYFCHIEQHHCQ